MAHDPNTSPVGWYLASYLLRFVELDDPDKDDPEKRFLSWENTRLVRAKSFDEAYKRALQMAKQECRPYRGGPDGVRVRWELVGMTDLLPIYEALEDGAELAWAERPPRKLRSLEKWVRSKKDLRR